MSIAASNPAAMRDARHGPTGLRGQTSLVLRFALRELRGGVRGFGVFLACLALGVAAIAGVGSFSRALTDGLAREGTSLLGGDAAFSLIQRERGIAPEQRGALARQPVGQRPRE